MNCSRLTLLLGLYGIVTEPPGSAPRREEQASISDIPNSKRVKIQYGPYLIPNANRRDLVRLSGMLSMYPHNDMER
jgi:hypothetical protein